MTRLFRLPDAVKHSREIEGWLYTRVPELGAMARAWFGRMRSRGSDVREVMHDGCPTACVEDAAFAYVGVFKAHANVGFFFGAELEDPAGLLEGTGKRMRHVKLKPGVGLDHAALKALIDTAYADMRLRVAAERSSGSGS